MYIYVYLYSFKNNGKRNFLRRIEILYRVNIQFQICNILKTGVYTYLSINFSLHFKSLKEVGRNSGSDVSIIIQQCDEGDMMCFKKLQIQQIMQRVISTLCMQYFT